MSFDTCVKNQADIAMRLWFWIIYYIPLTDGSVLCQFHAVFGYYGFMI